MKTGRQQIDDHGVATLERYAEAVERGDAQEAAAIARGAGERWLPPFEVALWSRLEEKAPAVARLASGGDAAFAAYRKALEGGDATRAMAIARDRAADEALDARSREDWGMAAVRTTVLGTLVRAAAEVRSGKVPYSAAVMDVEWEVQGSYGSGWERVTTECSRAEALMRLEEYRREEESIPHRVVRVAANAA